MARREEGYVVVSPAPLAGTAEPCGEVEGWLSRALHDPRLSWGKVLVVFSTITVAAIVGAVFATLIGAGSGIEMRVITQAFIGTSLAFVTTRSAPKGRRLREGALFLAAWAIATALVQVGIAWLAS